MCCFPFFVRVAVMSLFGDFQNAWSKRFPGCELPQAWEEDVRANLSRHRHRVAELKEELEKEAFYVEYLERLLADVEYHRRLTINEQRKSQEAKFEIDEHHQFSNKNEGDDDTSSQHGVKGHLKDLGLLSDDGEEGVRNADNPPEKVSSSPENDSEEIDDRVPRSGDNDETSALAATSDADKETREQCNKKSANKGSPFITVIEVNGCQETKPALTKDSSVDDDEDEDSSKVSLDSPSHNQSDSTGSSPAIRKKVPPKPPPKRLKRPLSTQSSSTARPAKDCPAAGTSASLPRPAQSCASPILGLGEDRGGVDHIVAGRVEAVKLTRSSSNPLKGVSQSEKGNLSAQKVGVPKSDSFKSNSSDTREAVVDGGGRHRKPTFSTFKSGRSSEDDNYLTLSSDKSSEYDDHTLKSQASGCSSHSGGLSDGDLSGLTESPASTLLPDDGASAEDDEGGGGGGDDDSPKYSDYVNIDYFLRKKAKQKMRVLSRGESLNMDSDEDDDGMDVLVQTLVQKSLEEERRERDRRTPEHLLTHPTIGSHLSEDVLDGDSGVYSSSVESTSFLCPSSPPTTPPTGGKWSQQPATNLTGGGGMADSAEAERIAMIKCIINTILESETIYLECLNVLIQYMKALRSTIGTSQPVISQEDLNVIFHKIPELHAIHQSFLEGIRNRVNQWDGKLTIGDHFKILATRLQIYASFLENYPRAIETIRKCSAENAKFNDITKSIKLKALKGEISLEDLLHKPVARVQKNALVLHDLLKYTPESHPDFIALKKALEMTQCFLNDFNYSATESMFPAHDRTQRLLVKNSFIIELSEGRRKLRHLFLFNDVIVCAKYKSSGRDKITYDVKWYIQLQNVVLPPDDGENKDVRETNPVNVLLLKSQVTSVRDLIMQDEHANKGKTRASGRNIDRLRKKLAELQAQLMLASPNLVFRIGHKSGKNFIFFLSSKFERNQWEEAITAVQATAPPKSPNLTLYELQAWIAACHKFLQTNMGSFLLRSGKADDVLVGDLHVHIHSMQGFSKPADVFLSLEVDSYGHFFRKATTKVSPTSNEPIWNQEFIVELEGSQMLRVLCYEKVSEQETVLRGKAYVDLNRSWLNNRMQEKHLKMEHLTLHLSLRFAQCEMSLRRNPSAKPCGVFGLKLSHVLKKEKRNIPFLISSCVREVEKRGLQELGVYRVSGSASDLQKLKRVFETNPYEAEQLIKEIDIHSVTGILKLYLRELPEGLFTDELYPKFLEAFSTSDAEGKSEGLLNLFNSLPDANKTIVIYLIDHMVKIVKEEAENKMSLQNVATVFGPTLLRLSAKLESGNMSDKLAAGTIDVMAQAGILYFYLKKRAAGESILPTAKE